MFGRGLVLLAAIAAVLVVGSSAASGQENPVVDPDTMVPATPDPGWLGRWLPEPQQRHLWIPNDATWPWNMTAAQGSYKNASGGTSFVQCLIEVGSDNPYWYDENMLYTRWAGGARCNLQMVQISGTSRLYQWNGVNPSFQVDSIAIGAQTQVPPGHGSGWQAYGLDYYTRTSNSQYLQIKVEVALEHSQGWWNSYPKSCERDVNNGRILRCELWSPPFQHPPYPCPTQAGKVGVQPGGCVTSPEMCASPYTGVQPSCINPQEEIEDLTAEPDALPAPESTGVGDDVPFDYEGDGGALVPDGDATAIASRRYGADCEVFATWRHSYGRDSHNYHFSGQTLCVGNAPPPTITGRATLYRVPSDGPRFVVEYGDFWDHVPTYIAYSDGVHNRKRRAALQVHVNFALDTPEGFKWEYARGFCHLESKTRMRCTKFFKKFH